MSRQTMFSFNNHIENIFMICIIFYKFKLIVREIEYKAKETIIIFKICILHFLFWSLIALIFLGGKDKKDYTRR